ncbi:TlpA family protein disulfide reductase [Dyadobacter aurulentus]|uniref:TlpA family protein disulfide reductase n=1 Tax=Dyadobacter sp. UC 10 TaxID=2605428 RepID=UPI001CEDA483|nr:thioredoxin fold domain-containing protein [Dyadobacter sp. UC 10]
MIRIALVTAWLSFLLSMVGALFWYHDWVYQLPTPVPRDYVPVATGTKINLDQKLPNHDGKPVLLHFYNPDCPCSRFNKSHFQSLVRSFSGDVRFMVVVLSDKKFTVDDIQDKIGLDIPVSFDQSLATQCGVYSTPQAALIDTDHRLYYRGNYNASRYCTDEQTAFAKIALEGLLQNESLPILDRKALTSYGCTMPVCKN